jgi:hypothetical protein
VDPSEPDREGVLARARLLAALLALSPLIVLGAVALLPQPGESRALVLPAGLLGLVAPALGWRLQVRLREGVRGGAAAGRRAYLRSLVAGLAVTEATALLGVLAWHLSREPAALLGVLLHLLLVSAMWPTEDRLERAEEDASA